MRLQNVLFCIIVMLGAACGKTVTFGGNALPKTLTLTFVAVQDGDAWKAVTKNADGKYVFTVGHDRYGLAYGCQDENGGSAVSVVYAAAGELTRVAAGCELQTTNPPSLVTIRGKFSGLAGNKGRIDVGGRSPKNDPVDGEEWTLEAESGTFDLFARRMTADQQWDRIVRRAAVPISDGARFDVDFAVEGVAPDLHTLTINGTSPGETSGGIVGFANIDGGSPFATPIKAALFPTKPKSIMGPNDIHSIVAAASTANTMRNVQHLMIVGADVTATLPALPADPTLTAGESAPYLRPSASIATKGDPDTYAIAYKQAVGPGSAKRYWSARVTRGWMALTKATAVVIPDLSAAAGFDKAWALQAGSAINWYQMQTWSSAGVSASFDDSKGSQLDGRESRSTQRSGTITF